MFAAAFGLMMGSVAAEDLQAHDFNGQFTLDVPGNYWMANAGAVGHQYEDGNGIKIQYITLNDINGKTFTDYVNSLGLSNPKTDGNFTIFQDNGKYVVITNSSDEMYIITDKNLDEAKAIAASAKLGTLSSTPSQDNSTSQASNTTSTGDMEKVTVGNVLTINAPKGSEFNNGTYDGFWVVYSAAECDAVIYYTNDETANTTIDEKYYDEFINNVTSQKGISSSKEDNVTVVEGIQNIDGTNAAYVHGDNAMVIVVSNDLNLVKEMAQTVEFIK